jgi:hypothetical protein
MSRIGDRSTYSSMNGKGVYLGEFDYLEIRCFPSCALKDVTNFFGKYMFTGSREFIMGIHFSQTFQFISYSLGIETSAIWTTSFSLELVCMAPRYTPATGGNWKKSPHKTNWIPPKGRSDSLTCRPI